MVHTSIQFKVGSETQTAVILDSSPATTKDYSAQSMEMHSQPSTSFHAIMSSIPRWPWAGTSAHVNWKYQKWFIAHPANKIRCHLNVSPKFWTNALASILAWKWYGNRPQKYATAGDTHCSSTFSTSFQPWSGTGRKKFFSLAFVITRRWSCQTDSNQWANASTDIVFFEIFAGVWNLCESSTMAPKHSISFWTKTSNTRRRMQCGSCLWCTRRMQSATASMRAIVTGAKWWNGISWALDVTISKNRSKRPPGIVSSIDCESFKRKILRIRPLSTDQSYIEMKNSNFFLLFCSFEILHVAGMLFLFYALFQVFNGINSIFGLSTTSALPLSLATSLWLFLYWL